MDATTRIKIIVGDQAFQIALMATQIEEAAAKIAQLESVIKRQGCEPPPPTDGGSPSE